MSLYVTVWRWPLSSTGQRASDLRADYLLFVSVEGVGTAGELSADMGQYVCLHHDGKGWVHQSRITYWRLPPFDPNVTRLCTGYVVESFSGYGLCHGHFIAVSDGREII